MNRFLTAIRNELRHQSKSLRFDMSRPSTPLLIYSSNSSSSSENDVVLKASDFKTSTDVVAGKNLSLSLSLSLSHTHSTYRRNLEMYADISIGDNRIRGRTFLGSYRSSVSFHQSLCGNQSRDAASPSSLTRLYGFGDARRFRFLFFSLSRTHKKTRDATIHRYVWQIKDMYMQ